MNQMPEGCYLRYQIATMLGVADQTLAAYLSTDGAPKAVGECVCRNGRKAPYYRLSDFDQYARQVADSRQKKPSDSLLRRFLFGQFNTQTILMQQQRLRRARMTRPQTQRVTVQNPYYLLEREA